MSEKKASVWRDFAESMRNSIVNPAAKSFRRAHAVTPAVLRVLTYPLAAVYTLIAWALALSVVLIVLGILALVAWASGGSMAFGKQVDREAAREKVRAAKEERAARRSS